MLTNIRASATHAKHTGGFPSTYLRAGTKEKWAGAFGEKFLGLSRGLLPVDGGRKRNNLWHLLRWRAEKTFKEGIFSSHWQWAHVVIFSGHHQSNDSHFVKVWQPRGFSLVPKLPLNICLPDIHSRSSSNLSISCPPRNTSGSNMPNWVNLTFQMLEEFIQCRWDRHMLKHFSKVPSLLHLYLCILQPRG